MNPKSYQISTDSGSTRARCPVCHETVYSRAGIHPQCAVRQSDPPKAKSVKEPKQPGEGAEVVEKVATERPAEKPAGKPARVSV
jgi:hypothetical protein